MSDDTLDTISSLLEAVIADTDDSEVHYQLRTALQLLELHRDDLTRLDEAVDGDSELRERLQDLGYIE